jgi:RNA polymerase sigma-70 factor (ECF subfamily)
MDEIETIHLAQQGNLDAFNQLVMTYQEVAYNVAYRILSDEDASEDATQNAFLSAYRSIQSYRGGSFKAWILRIVTNTCYDELRRLKRHPTTPLQPVLDDSEDEIETPTWMRDDGLTPEEAAEQSDLNRTVQHCLDGLPDEFKMVVVLVDLQGMDYQEVSNSIGKPLGTIKSRLARARLKLRDCLRGSWELLPVNERLESEEQ